MVSEILKYELKKVHTRAFIEMFLYSAFLVVRILNAQTTVLFQYTWWGPRGRLARYVLFNANKKDKQPLLSL